MTDASLSAQIEALREPLAALAHEQWAGWMRHFYSKAQTIDNGDYLCIPKVWWTRWLRQMDTAYAGLSEKEKESDRAEADRVLALLASVPQQQTEGFAGLPVELQGFAGLPVPQQTITVTAASANQPYFAASNQATCPTCGKNEWTILATQVPTRAVPLMRWCCNHCDPQPKGAAVSLHQETPAAEHNWTTASKFVRGVIEALGFTQPPPDSNVNLDNLLLQVIGQIEELKAESAVLVPVSTQEEKETKNKDLAARVGEQTVTPGARATAAKS